MTGIAALAAEVADRLLGTTADLTLVLEEMGRPELEDDSGFTYELDMLAWRCASCDWWVEPCELEDVDGEDWCQDCAGD